MKKRISILLIIFIVFWGSMIPAFTQGQQESQIVLTMAYTDAGTWPEIGNLPLAEHAYGLIFKQIVESRTNGRVIVELYPGNVLAESKQAVEMVKTGTLDLVIETGVMGGFFPESQVISLPYVFQSDEIAWHVFDHSEYWKNLMEEMEAKTGLKYLGMGQNGTRHFTNSKRPIHEPNDMKGLKFRVMQAPIFVKMVESLGAQAIPMPHGEIYTSCQTGVVDGQENPIWNIVANSWYEVQDYMILDGHMWSENMLLMNAKKFNSLSPDIQHIIKIAAFHGQWADRASESLKSRITDFDILAKHMEIYSPTLEEIKKFQDAVQPVYEWLRDEIGSEVVDEFIAAVKDAEKILGY